MKQRSELLGHGGRLRIFLVIRGGQLILSTLSVPASQEINVDVRIGRWSVLLMTINISASNKTYKNLYMRSAFSLDSLIQKLTILVLNAALHFVILAFANR